MKQITVLLALALVACGDNLDSFDEVTPDAGLADTLAAPLDTTAEPDAPMPCVGACYQIVGFNAYFAATRVDGQPWDADGSLPEPVLGVRVHRVTLGETTPRSEPFLHYPPPTDLYRVTWDEAVGATPLNLGDEIEVYVVDAQERYTLTRCLIKVAAVHLAYGNVACFETTQIEIHLKELP